MSRSFVLVAVLLVTVALAAGLLAMLSGVRGQSETVAAIAELQAQRHAARSAAYAIAAEIGAERERLLSGAPPDIDENRSLIRFENEPGWRMTIEAEEGRELLRALSGAIDVHEASVDSIEAVAPGEGERLVRGRPYRTPGQLRAVLGESSEVDRESTINEMLFTLVSVDPPLRSGAGGPAGSVGEARTQPATGQPTPNGLSPEGGAFFTAIADGSWRPSSLGHILREAEVRGVPEEDWDLLLDTVAVGEVSARRGMIDLNSAPSEVIASIPGIDTETASAIVDRRDSLTDDDRSGLSWPVREGIVPLARYADIVDRLTVRSMQVGVRFRVEREKPDALAGEPDAALPRGGSMVFEGIVDASGERARLVYLRDVTFEAEEAGEKLGDASESDEEPEAEPAPEHESGAPHGDMQPRDTRVSEPPHSRAWGRFVAEVASE